MFNRKRYLLLTLFVALVGLGSSYPLLAQPAQPDSSFNEIPLNGLASFSQLRKEYFIGGLYLESLSQEDSGAIFSFSGRKRMELRITIDKWSPRRFAQQWNQSILINNDQELQSKYADEILKFVDMLKDDLVVGDRITIDMDSNGTIVYINNNRMFRVKDKEFFDVLLNTWIGPRPPSSEFKNDILTLPTDAEGTALLSRYEATIPTDARTKLVAKWSTDPGTRKVAAAAAPVAAQKSAAASVEPDAVTSVKARREGSTASSSKPEIAAPAVATTAPAMAAPKPKLQVEKPKIAAAPTAKPEPKPAPKAEPKPAPKPEPKQVAKAEPKPEPKPAPAAKKEAPKQVAKAEPKESAEDKEQARLMRMYRSNVLKLTYLNTQYPKKAMDFKQEGLVVLKVTINRKGDIDDIEEATSSEHQLLNKAARRAVQKSEPYPEIPKALKGETVVVTLPFNFRL